MTEEVLRTKPHQSTATSILYRQRTLTSNHQCFQLELITVESDGQLNQSSEKPILVNAPSLPLAKGTGDCIQNDQHQRMMSSIRIICQKGSQFTTARQHSIY